MARHAPRQPRTQRPSQTDEPQAGHVAVGRIVGAWGVRGHLKVEPLTDFPQTRFAPGAALYLRGAPHTVEEARQQRPHLLLKLKGIDSREAARGLRGALLQVPEHELHPLAEGQYYQFQVEGLAVYTVDGQYLGRVAEVLTLPSNDVYVVHGPRGEVLLPALDDVILQVDLGAGRMEVDPPQGTVPG